MRQLLILGFYCEVYRREPRCRVYANDILLDEFDIPHTPRIDTWSDDMILDPKQTGPSWFVFESSPSFYKFIEFDDLNSMSLDVRVEIQNNDNNYTNGFMTQHTLVMLSQCYLGSIKLWEKFDQIKTRWKFSKYNWHKHFGRTKSIDHYYSGNRNIIIENLGLHSDLYFPDINQPLQRHDSPAQWWIGSSGYFHLTLTKKLGFWRHSKDCRRGWWKIVAINFIKHLYDKYKQYEDKRSSNT